MRVEAEARLAQSLSSNASVDSAAAILHELLVRRIELEMQNERLREIQVALQNSRDRYFDLYELAPVAYLTLNFSGQISQVNQNAATLLGESKEHLCHSDFVRLIDDEDRYRWVQCFRQALKQGGQRECVLTLRRKNGSLFDGDLHYSLFRQGAGPAELLIALTDVTTQKKGELKARGVLEQQQGDFQQHCNEESLALQTSQERMRQFFQGQIIGMAITSPEKGWLQVNDAFCDFLDYSSSGFLQMNWADQTYPDDLKACVVQFERILSGEVDSISQEKRFVRKDGEIVRTKRSIRCVRRTDRSVDCVLAVLEDIRERKRLEAESLAIKAQLGAQSTQLQASRQELERRVEERTAELYASNQRLARREREFRMLAEGLPDNIIRHDRNGAVVYLNPPLEKTLGGVAVGMIGVRVREWFSDGSFETYAQALDFVLATGLDREIEIFSPDPRLPSDVIHQVRFVAERDENGEVVGALAIGRDVSALKRSERELEASRRQLRGLVARREEDLEDERKRIAREVHDELGQLLTGLQMKLGRLVRKCGGNNPVVAAYAKEALILSKKALGVARNVALALRPAVLDMGIVSALEWLADRFAADTGIACQVRIVDDDIQLNDNQAIALFRITQESLTNISRHARADQVGISLNKSAESYVLKIRDDGVGFDNAIRKHGSFGLVGIQERALMLGGTVAINTGLGSGTEVAVCIPVSGRQEIL
jgi:PAS domain S-box-containing protein